MLRNAVLINKITLYSIYVPAASEDMRGGNINKYACELTILVFTKFHETPSLDGLISTDNVKIFSYSRLKEYLQFLVERGLIDELPLQIENKNGKKI